MSYSGGVNYNVPFATKKPTIDNSANKVMFDIGLSLGYQHYFGESENHGIKSSFYIGAGIPHNSQKENETSGIIITDTVTDKVSLKTQTIPLKTRIELDYLWDFFQKGKHTIGLDAGIGYEIGVWFGNGETGRGQIWKTSSGKVIEAPAKINKIPTEALITHNFYPKIGLHYYYGNHQFNIAYKFGGILSGIAGDRKLVLIPDKTLSPNMDLDYRESIQSSPSYFSFGYSYRF